MAEDMRKNFVLINLVKHGREETKFQSYIKQNNIRRFSCLTWEEIYGFIVSGVADNAEKRHRVMRYMECKSVGYERGELKAAFPTLRCDA